MDARRRLSLWLPPAAWAALIFAFSSMPDLHSGLAYDFPLRKLAHAVEYAVLAGLLRRAAAGQWPARGPGWAAGFAFAASALYAVSDEWHQSFVPGRRGALSDCLIDAGGAAAWLALTEARRRGMLSR